MISTPAGTAILIGAATLGLIVLVLVVWFILEIANAPVRDDWD